MSGSKSKFLGCIFFENWKDIISLTETIKLKLILFSGERYDG